MSGGGSLNETPTGSSQPGTIGVTMQPTDRESLSFHLGRALKVAESRQYIEAHLYTLFGTMFAPLTFVFEINSPKYGNGVLTSPQIPILPYDLSQIMPVTSITSCIPDIMWILYNFITELGVPVAELVLASMEIKPLKGGLENLPPKTSSTKNIMPFTPPQTKESGFSTPKTTQDSEAAGGFTPSTKDSKARFGSSPMMDESVPSTPPATTQSPVWFGSSPLTDVSDQEAAPLTPPTRTSESLAVFGSSPLTVIDDEDDHITGIQRIMLDWSNKASCLPTLITELSKAVSQLFKQATCVFACHKLQQVLHVYFICGIYFSMLKFQRPKRLDVILKEHGIHVAKKKIVAEGQVEYDSDKLTDDILLELFPPSPDNTPRTTRNPHFVMYHQPVFEVPLNKDNPHLSNAWRTGLKLSLVEHGVGFRQESIFSFQMTDAQPDIDRLEEGQEIIDEWYKTRTHNREFFEPSTPHQNDEDAWGTNTPKKEEELSPAFQLRGRKLAAVGHNFTMRLRTKRGQPEDDDMPPPSPSQHRNVRRKH
ncbi:hypothetical protein E1B28_006982 [Marasmius oreades]|uniref:Uncharacterized protein n=1 Tax=Marasmius oreades TaxID=181124 RepID=A0A9P7S0Z3_9AGAR|nr:uncharacterized protein E1B28_006982 [Marasmius oreades]KAG7093300.1 hypothetical protein E1B28_006982 [Marasmius oreades]